jgi:hypothetical protein
LGLITIDLELLLEEGLIKINNSATLEILPLEEGLQFFVTFWNEGTNRVNTFCLAMIH